MGYFASIAAIWLYCTLMESSSRQATLGKMALGIIVTDMNGHRVSWGRANARYWSHIVSNMILMIGYIMTGFTEKKQALHDMIAGTLVLKG
ncbi:MAG TPA: RDD family protein [Armatimonadota bacterium]|nr:RDD family protein [Armatimonadota bacterium]